MKTLRVTCNNRESEQLYNKLKTRVVNIIKSSRLRRKGHIVRMDDNELPIKSLWTNPGGQRGRGRPKSRWFEGIGEGSSKPGCRNWRAAAQDRGRWRHCLRRPRSTQGCTADRGDDDDDDDDDVLLAILTSYKHKLVRICVVFEALTSIKCAKFSLPSSVSILPEQRSFQSGGDVYCDALG